MGDAYAASHRLPRQHALERTDFADAPPDLEPPVLEHAEARRVVATVLEPLEAVQKYRACVPLPDIPDDAAHEWPAPSSHTSALTGDR